MKKLLLLSAILVGAATASQAGISFNIGMHLPTPRGAVISQAWGPVYDPCVVMGSDVAYQPVAPACDGAPAVVAPPVWAPRVAVFSRPPVIERGIDHVYVHEDRHAPRSRGDYGHNDWSHQVRSHR